MSKEIYKCSDCVCEGKASMNCELIEIDIKSIKENIEKLKEELAEKETQLAALKRKELLKSAYEHFLTLLDSRPFMGGKYSIERADYYKTVILCENRDWFKVGEYEYLIKIGYNSIGATIYYILRRDFDDLDTYDYLYR